MKITRILVLALCFTVCLSGYAEKKKRKEYTSSSSDIHLRIDEGGYKHEVLLNGNTMLGSFALGSSGGNLAFASGNTIVSFGAGYNYDIIPILQIGIFPSVGYYTALGTFFTLLAGPTLNLSLNGDIQDAFFLSGALGFSTAPGLIGTNFDFRFDLGKRFRIWDHVCYRPSFGVIHTLGTTFFAFNFMGASVAF